MSVPKCKDCKCHDNKPNKGWGQRTNRCFHDGVIDGLKINPLNRGKFIFAKEMTTSPKWCPKRNKKECSDTDSDMQHGLPW